MRRVGGRRALIAILVVVALAASACGGDGDGGEAGGDEPVRGGTLTWSIVSEPATLEPKRGNTGTSTNGVVYQAMYDTLVTVDPAEGIPKMRLAESVTSNAGGTQWTIKLRPNLKFSDGTPFTTAAIKAHWDRQADPATAAASLTTMRTMTSWEPRDDDTFVVTLPRARGSFVELLAGDLGAIPSPTAVAAHGANYGSSPETTVGAGPFILTEWVRGSEMRFRRNPNYFREAEPYLDTLVAKVIGDARTIADALRTATIDLAFVSANPDIMEQLDGEGYASAQYAAPAAYGPQFNVSRAPFNDVNVRRAFTLATDVVDVNTKATEGAGPVAGGPDAAWYPKGHPLYDPKVKQKDSNLAEAQKLIDAYVAINGPINFEMHSANELAPLLNAVAQSWSRLKGVTVRTNPVAATQSILLHSQGNFSASITLTPGFEYVDQAYERFKCDSPRNLVKYCNPKMDALLEANFGVSDLEARKKVMNDMAQILVDDALFVRVYYQLSGTFVQDYVGGYDTLNYSPSRFPHPALIYRRK